ncbi:hypothetical protein PINS_up008524 [Pythium insidiosum]|nr:hypothetical protein PINS_up008524 [Pythium insidiosum]
MDLESGTHDDDDEGATNREAKRQLREHLIMMSLVVFVLLYSLLGLVYCLLVTTSRDNERQLPKTPSPQGHSALWVFLLFVALITWCIYHRTRSSRGDRNDATPSLAYYTLAALYCIADFSLCALGIVLLCFIVRRPTQQILALIT